MAFESVGESTLLRYEMMSVMACGPMAPPDLLLRIYT
jgi:hypothetical protein